jgi:hypothetical protein
MSSPNSLALHATHSHCGGRGGRPGGGLGSSLGSIFGMRHSPRLGERSAGVVSGTTTRQGRGAGGVFPMAYSTPAWFLTFSKVVATSQGHSTSSLSQSQSTLAARRKGDTHPLKGNVAKKKRSKLDTDDGSPQKGNAAKQKRGNLGTGYEAAGKRSANTLTKDDANYNDKEERRGKNDAWDEA